ncbi:MAG: tRNA threonylcarbamoyladenosine dehydratase [Clostridia bacterium]|nr:tRNA threonylcarbamoyladenosine dehydratase [Clostridia bacterium]
MEDMFTRTRLLIGDEAVEKLKCSSVIVFGAGGVGSYCIEALARAGVGSLCIVDGDTVAISNINRQLYALNTTVGKAKAEVAKERILDINPDVKVDAKAVYLNNDTLPSFDLGSYSFVVDAIDMVTAKILLAVECESKGIPEISAMGAGNRLSASFSVTDIYSTSGCPLARVMRRELKKRGVQKLKVVFCEDPAAKHAENERTIASISYVPAMAGLKIAEEVIKTLIS